MMEDSEDPGVEDANPVVVVERDDPLFNNYTAINEIAYFQGGVCEAEGRCTVQCIN